MDNEILLISTTYESDAIGQQIAKETVRPVWCDVRSVSASEWFEGGRQGLVPEYRVTMFGPDYQGEDVVEFEGVRYGVYRTYRGKGETIELYIARKAGV